MYSQAARWNRHSCCRNQIQFSPFLSNSNSDRVTPSFPSRGIVHPIVVDFVFPIPWTCLHFTEVLTEEDFGLSESLLFVFLLCAPTKSTIPSARNFQNTAFEQFSKEKNACGCRSVGGAVPLRSSSNVFLWTAHSFSNAKQFCLLWRVRWSWQCDFLVKTVWTKLSIHTLPHPSLLANWAPFFNYFHWVDRTIRVQVCLSPCNVCNCLICHYNLYIAPQSVEECKCTVLSPSSCFDGGKFWPFWPSGWLLSTSIVNSTYNFDTQLWQQSDRVRTLTVNFSVVDIDAGRPWCAHHVTLMWVTWA